MWWKHLMIPVNHRTTNAFISSNPMRIRRFDLGGGGGSIAQSVAAKKRLPSSSVTLSTVPSSSSSSNPEYSERGVDAVGLLPTYLADARQVEKYCPKTCRHGALQLSVAENQMLEHLLVPALTKFGTQAPAFDTALIYYQPTHGRLELRKAMASYLQRILKLGDRQFTVDGMIVGAGCNAVLENLCFCLASQGDAVLIPTPYYAAFEFDLVARAGLFIQPVTTFAHHDEVEPSLPIGAEAYYPNSAALDAAYEKSCQAGHPPRVLLLSHPNNPLGICYPPHVIQECIDWCRQRQVHLVSDEIYAGSVYRNNGEAFTSTVKLASTETPHDDDGLGLGPYVHLVYALSKDFALSGLRIGACYTENESIRLPMQKLNDLCQISSQTQVLVQRMLESREEDAFWTETFLEQSNELIRERCDALQSCLDDCNIPYLQADSGLFVWMDFREFLPENNKDDIQVMERTLYLELLHDFGLLFTPGLSMKNELAGFFRCVFTAATEEEFNLGLNRIRNFVATKRKNPN